MKKLSAIFLAMVMCMALAIPVFAGDATTTPAAPPNDKLDYTVDLEEPTIQVTVPDTGAAVKLNPYQIKVTSEDLGASNSTDSILAPVMYLTNESNVPLKMSLVATGSIPSGSNAAFATAAPEATEKNRKVFMFIDIGDVTEAETPDEATLSAATYSASNTKQGIIKAGDLKMNDILTIPVPTGDSNYVPVSIGGACATTPTTAWSSADVVNLSVTFTFVATNNTPAAASSGSSSGGTAPTGG